MTSKKTSVATGAAIIAAGTLLSRLLGLVRERLLLGTFGDSDITGAYNSAFMVPDLLYYLLAGGALSAAFIPVFSAYLAKGQKEDAYRTGSSTVNLMLISLCIGVAIELIFAPYIVHLVAPGYKWGSEVFNLTVSLTRLMCGMVIFTAISGLFTAALNSYHHFLAPTLVWNTYNLSIIFGITVLSKVKWHGEPLGIYGAALGVVIGAFTMAAFQFPVLLKHGFRFAAKIDFQHEGVRKVLVLFLPVMIGLALSQFNMLAAPLIIGSKLGAPAVTDIRAANRLVLLPLGLIAIAISTAAFPMLAQQFARGEKDAFRRTVSQAIRAIMLLTVPCMIGMFILAEPMTYLLWGGGEFGKAGVQASAFVLLFFTWALLGISLMQVINRAFYSLQDTITPVIVSVIMVISNLLLALFLITTDFKYGGVAIATAVTMNIAALVLLDLLRRRLGGIDGRAMTIMTLKVTLASAIMGVAIYFVATYLAPAIGTDRLTPAFRWPAPPVPFSKPHVPGGTGLDAPTLGLAIQIGASMVVGGVVYFASLWMLRVKELSLVTSKIMSKFRKTPASV